MMNVIRFCGRNKRESVKKAMDFYFDNGGEKSLEVFLAKCRVQEDGITVNYYPNMKVDLDKYREFKATRRKERQKGKK